MLQESPAQHLSHLRGRFSSALESLSQPVSRGLCLRPGGPYHYGKLLSDDQLVNRQLADAELFDPALPNYDPSDSKRANGYCTNSRSTDCQPKG
jgi:hypothetical protein